MQRNHFLSRFAKGFATSLGLVSGLFLFVMLAYAFTTWDPGLAPQASPVNGNITLSNSPSYMPGGWYGLCDSSVTTFGENSWANPCSGAIAPATCTYSNYSYFCGCPTGFTAKGIKEDFGDANGGTTISHFYCIKN
ncbi:MAG: hypothetical protein PHO48_02000 [Candidatus Gracilibacteria bacterium]|nr:hypothetical protein [Candidatus Gracilibacteria bacterium]MDD5178917.1 hypothetical protein [Candidatus Gracilibacteria bacterium]